MLSEVAGLVALNTDVGAADVGAQQVPPVWPIKPAAKGAPWPGCRVFMKYCVQCLMLLGVVTGLGAPAALAQIVEEPPASSSSSGEASNGSAAASEDEPDAAQAPLDPAALPVDINRIQRRLSRPPAIRPEAARPVFRTEVFGRSPTIDEILGPNWRRGPAPAAAMTHQEFLNLVTPKDVQGYAAFDNRQALTVAATSFALQWALRQAVRKLDDAITARQKEAAQREVDEALAALRKARREAGLPD